MTDPRGNIYLIDRAPLDITYQHTIDFKTAEEQLDFWRSLVKYSFSNYSYVRRERRFINIDKDFESLEAINYLFFRSRENSKYYYCFVTEREYINDNTTRLYFEIDVLQTFMFDYTFQPSFIAQGHVDRWNAELKPIYSRTEENLNYGSEYITEQGFKIVPEAIKHGFYFILLKTGAYVGGGLSGAESSKIRKAPTPYNICIIPNVETDLQGTEVFPKVTYINGMGEAETANIDSIKTFFDFMSNSAIGESIQQIVYVPYLPFKYNYFIDEGYPHFQFLEGSFGVSILQTTEGEHAATCTVLKMRDASNVANVRLLSELGIFEGLENAIPTEKMWNDLKANPYRTERDRRFESKLLCFPYRYNVFTDWKSPPALIKNEYLCGDKIEVYESYSFGFNMPRRYFIKDYRRDYEGREASIVQQIPLEQTIINDAYYTYMLQNKNQISANLANAQVNAALSIGQGMTSGAVSGAAAGPAGAIGGALTGALSNGLSAAVSVSNMMRSEIAKQNDIKAIPDTITNSNDCSFAILDQSKYLYFYRKVISCEYMEQLAQYWHMFGYIVKRVEVPNLRSRLRYNYIKTVGANIYGRMESQYIAAIKAIYDNGVTIWHYSENDFFPLDYTYENPERNLL